MTRPEVEREGYRQLNVEVYYDIGKSDNPV